MRSAACAPDRARASPDRSSRRSWRAVRPASRFESLRDPLVDARARRIEQHDIGRQRVGKTSSTRRAPRAKPAGSLRRGPRDASRSSSIAVTRTPARSRRVAVAPEPAYASTTVARRDARTRAPARTRADRRHLRIHLHERRTRRFIAALVVDEASRACPPWIHQSAVSDGTASKNWSRAGQLSPPFITRVGPPLVDADASRAARSRRESTRRPP